MSNRARQAKKIAEWSKKDLVHAKEWAKTSSSPTAKREARIMAREAKRRRSRAQRRASKALCDELTG